MTHRTPDFGGLGDPAERTRAAEEQHAATQARGRHLPVYEGIRGGMPGLLAAWESRLDGWWGRVVIDRDGEAAELRGAARLLKPAHTSEATTDEA